jgi:hypothetical protein
MLEVAMPETGPLTEATVLPVAAERAVWAIAELAAGCPDNQELVRQLHGIAPLVWLLDGPADSMITIGEQPGMLLDLCKSSCEMHRALSDMQLNSMTLHVDVLLSGIERIGWELHNFCHLLVMSSNFDENLTGHGTRTQILQSSILPPTLACRQHADREQCARN